MADEGEPAVVQQQSTEGQRAEAAAESEGAPEAATDAAAAAGDDAAAPNAAADAAADDDDDDGRGPVVDAAVTEGEGSGDAGGTPDSSAGAENNAGAAAVDASSPVAAAGGETDGTAAADDGASAALDGHAAADAVTTDTDAAVAAAQPDAESKEAGAEAGAEAEPEAAPEPAPEPQPLPARAADAVTRGDAGALQELLEEAAPAVAEAVNEQKLLHRACMLGKVNVVQALLELDGVSLELPDTKKRSVLHCALDCPPADRKAVALDVLGTLVRRMGAKVGDGDGGDTTALQLMVNSRDGLGRSCVDMAAGDGGEGMLLGKLLFLKGNPGTDSVKHKPPVALAAMAGLPHHVRALCAAKADVNAGCQDEANGSCTALIYAAMEGHVKVVKVLLAAGANTAEVDTANGNTARQWAATMQNHACERILAAAEESADRKAQLEAEGAKVDNPFDLFEPASEDAAAKVHRELVSLETLEARKRAIEAQNRVFVSAAPGKNFKPLMQCFLRHVLKDQPSDVMGYAARFFTREDLPQAVLASTPTKP